MNLRPGEWRGEYRDVNGFSGELSMDLESDDEEFSGSFELTIADEDEPVEIDGRVRGTVRDGEVAFEVLLAKMGDKPLEYTGELRDAGSYAQQALIGSVAPAADLNLGGGVWIAWRFGREGR